jgi:hypothetical protein
MREVCNLAIENRAREPWSRLPSGSAQHDRNLHLRVELPKLKLQPTAFT